MAVIGRTGEVSAARGASGLRKNVEWIDDRHVGRRKIRNIAGRGSETMNPRGRGNQRILIEVPTLSMHQFCQVW